MKKIIIMLLTIVICLALCACGKGFSERLFEGDGIYQEFDSLPEVDREKILSDAVKEGYTLGFDVEGRITLTKDGKYFVLGESRMGGK